MLNSRQLLMRLTSAILNLSKRIFENALQIGLNFYGTTPNWMHLHLTQLFLLGIPSSFVNSCPLSHQRVNADCFLVKLIHNLCPRSFLKSFLLKLRQIFACCPSMRTSMSPAILLTEKIHSLHMTWNIQITQLRWRK